ncbi:H/ACA ribonucleoprotein complex non-core subunit NAF1 [Rhypophila decipiens]
MSGEPFRIPGLGQLPVTEGAIAPDVAIAAQYALADQKKLAELAAKDTNNEPHATETTPIDHNQETAMSTQNQATVENTSEAATKDAMEIESKLNPTMAAITNPVTEVVTEGTPNVENSNEGTTQDAMDTKSEATDAITVEANGQGAPDTENGNEASNKDAMEIKTEANSTDSATTHQVMEVVATETNGQGPANGDIISTLDAALALEDVPQEAEAEHPEWDADSSPYESSSEDSSDDSSDDDSDDGDHPMLGIEETVRLLMAEDDNDGDGDGHKQGRGPAPLRSKNELDEAPLPKPKVTITPEMRIELIGHVASVVETTMVIESLKDGETRVLNIGSVLCKEDRTVVGALADTFGPVREPRYLVFFDKPDEITDLGLEKGTPIYYSVAHADYVFTQALKQEKGTDASNLHDEELAPEEMEFSDDEKEAEYKRSLKNKKKGGKKGRGRDQNPSAELDQGELRYDEDEDGPYRPLARPEAFAQGVPSFLPPRPDNGYVAAPPTGRGGSHRGRGPRGGHRGGRGGHGGRGGRGGHGGHGGSNNYENPPAAPRPYAMAQPPPTSHGFVPPPPPGWNGQPAFPAPLAPFSQPPQGHQHQVPSAAFNFGFQGWNQGQQGPPAPAPGYSPQGWQAPATGPNPAAAYGNAAYYQGNGYNQQQPGQGRGQPPAYWPHGQPPT